MQRVILYLFFAVMPIIVCGQHISDSIVFRDDTPDSTFIKGGVYFDKGGFYLAKENRNKDSQKFFTPERAYGPFATLGSESSTNQGSLSYTGFRREEERSGDSAAWYYWHGFGTKVHGLVTGEMVRFNTEDSREAISLVLRVKDSLFYYIDGSLVGASVYEREIESSSERWCVFSSGGRALYQLPVAGGYILYLDGRPVDSSGVRFYAMSVDDDGRFLYASRLKGNGKQKGGVMGRADDGYSYDVMLRTRDGDYGPVGAVDNFKVGQHSMRFVQGYRGFAEGDTGYVFLDGRLYHGVGSVLEVSLADRGRAAFISRDKKGLAAYARGKRYPLPYESTSLLAADSAGNFALCGWRDYYLYVFANGAERKQPLSKHSARGTPIALDARGNALVAYRNDDSTWIYYNDSLLLPPIANRTLFEILTEQDLLRNYRRDGEPTYFERPAAFRLGDAFYVWYRGILSAPLALYADTTDGGREGSGVAIEAADANEHRFFLLYHTGTDRFALNLNNTVFHTFDAVDRLVYKNQWLNAEGLVFYAQKGRNFHRYFVRP